MLNHLHIFGENLPLAESLAQHGVRLLDLLIEQTAEVARNVAAALMAINPEDETRFYYWRGTYWRRRT